MLVGRIQGSRSADTWTPRRPAASMTNRVRIRENGHLPSRYGHFCFRATQSAYTDVQGKVVLQHSSSSAASAGMIAVCRLCLESHRGALDSVPELATFPTRC